MMTIMIVIMTMQMMICHNVDDGDDDSDGNDGNDANCDLW